MPKARAARSRQRSGPSSIAALLPALALMLLAAGSAPALAAPPATPAQAGQPQTGLAIVPLSITTADGRSHSYRVEIARTPGQQAHGMMFRTEVPAATGMLFPFEAPRTASFWMENTLVPLDLLFIGADGRVRNIAANAQPKSQALLNSVGPVAAVLELAGGEAERIGARPGDRIRWGK